MKEILLGAAACLVAAGCGQGHPPTSSAAPAQTPAGKVFLEGKGPDREVQRFKKFLAIALEDNGLASAGTPSEADAVAKVDFTEQDATRLLYAPVVRVVFTAQHGEKYLVQSCNSVSTNTDVYEDPVKYFSFPVNWKKEHAAISAIYINHAEFKNFESLVQVLEKSLADQGYRVVNSIGEADTQLASIGIQKLAVPMRTHERGLRYEILDKDSNRFAYSSGASSIKYLGPESPIKLADLPCSTFAHFNQGVVESYMWTDAVSIANAVQGHLKRTTAQPE